jgi:formylglycine-generating enzyme required for sulfatase activity
MKLALVPAGKFVMGSPPDEAERGDDEPQHEVEITRPLYVGAYEVTQEEFTRVVGTNPSWFCATANGKDRVEGMDTRRFPVEKLSWHQADDFCRKLSALPAEKEAGRVYRLPTEAEWEYACRGGSSDPGPFFFKKPGRSLSAKQANFNGGFPYGGAPEIPALERTTAVGSYEPNGFGLYDLQGNVSEWCHDAYEREYYRSGPKQDPPGPTAGPKSARVHRGGSWLNFGEHCRAADREWLVPGQGNIGIGFRVVAPIK